MLKYSKSRKKHLSRSLYTSFVLTASWEQGWRSGWRRDGVRLLPMCLGFDSRTRRHMWAEFVVGSLLCSERFFSGYSGFPSPQKSTFPNSSSILEYPDISKRVLDCELFSAPWLNKLQLFLFLMYVYNRTEHSRCFFIC